MTINTIIDYLNKTRGYQLSSAYYSQIATWKKWWKGFDEEFHRFVEIGYDGKQIKRELYGLRMAKKVCEDWAAILLNEATEVTLGDEAAAAFLLGSHGVEGVGDVDGVFDKIKFWDRANMLGEKAFATGTGVFVLRLKNMNVTEDGNVTPSPDAEVYVDCLTAEHIIPLSTEFDDITEAAFWSAEMKRGKTMVYLELHLLEEDGLYKIENHYFEEEEGSLKEVDPPEHVAPVIYTKSPVPFFSILKPNIANNIDEDTMLGISVYANALDVLKGVDLAYNNMNKDFKLGGKKVFLNNKMIKYDEATGKRITPDDVAQQLFITTGDGMMDSEGKKMIEEFNPSLRVDENKEGIQGQLDYLSFKCGFGTKHYQFNAGQIVTATQYTGDKQELLQNASKHYITVTTALVHLIRAILWAGKNICGVQLNENTSVKIKYDDSFVTDKETERLRDRNEVDCGIMQKWEYRMKWYGEDEEKAKAMTKVEGIGSYFGGE